MGNKKKDKGVKRDPQEPREDRAKSSRPSTEKNDFQNPRSSGTTGLGGESRNNSVREPGGVEGVEGRE